MEEITEKGIEKLMLEFKKTQRPIFITGGIGDGRAVDFWKSNKLKAAEQFFFEVNKVVNFFAYSEDFQQIAFDPVFSDQFKGRYPNHVRINEKELLIGVRLNFDLERCLEMEQPEVFRYVITEFITTVRDMQRIAGFDNIGFATAMENFFSNYQMVN